jgi:hypothetical protein
MTSMPGAVFGEISASLDCQHPADEVGMAAGRQRCQSRPLFQVLIQSARAMWMRVIVFTILRC